MEEETTPEVSEETTEEVVAEESNEPTNDDTNEAEAPVEEAEAPVEEDEDDDVLNYQPQRFQVEPVDYSKLPADENGNIDPSAFAQAQAQQYQTVLEQARAQARDELMQVRQEEKLWKKAEKEFPEIAGNRELRNLVQNTRYGIIASGKNASPLDAAKQIFKHLGTARQQGQTQAKESVRIQRSAQLETSSTQAAPRSSNADLMSKISSPDRATSENARQALLAQWIEDGTIKTR